MQRPHAIIFISPPPAGLKPGSFDLKSRPSDGEGAERPGELRVMALRPQIGFARRLRREATEGEKILWRVLREALAP